MHASSKAKHAPSARVQADYKLLRSVTPSGLDPLRAVRTLFGKPTLAAAVEFEELPDEALWSLDMRPALLWRSAMALKSLDTVLGGERWRRSRPRGMADVHMLAEEAAVALRRLGAARTPMSSDPGKRRRARSPSSSSESGSDERGSGKRGKGQVAGKGECVGPDVAEALHRGKAFCEEADDSISEGGRVGEAMASVPAELKGLLRRALVSDKVSNNKKIR